MAQSTAQWGIQSTQVQNFWNAGYTGQGVIVSVHDSGCSPHEDLQGAIIGSYNAFDTSSSDTSDCSSSCGNHGTSTHGIIGARNNDVGYIGYAYNCQLYNVKHSHNGQGSAASVARGIDWAVARNPRPHIMCLNVQLQSGSTTLRDSVRAANQAGVLLVGAAGNWAEDSNWSGDMAYPARYPEVLAVGAVNSSLTRASYSNIGPNLDVVSTTGMMAPGKNTAVPVSSNYGTVTGTSCATPSCAGLLAVLKSAYPSYTNVQLKNKLYEGLQDLGVSGRDDEYGNGFTRLLSSMLPAGGVSPTTITEDFADTNFNFGITQVGGWNVLSGRYTCELTSAGSKEFYFTLNVPSGASNRTAPIKWKLADGIGTPTGAKFEILVNNVVKHTTNGTTSSFEDTTVILGTGAQTIKIRASMTSGYILPAVDNITVNWS